MQPQETNPASKQAAAETLTPSKASHKPMTPDEKKGCGCMILILLVLCFLLNKCACSDSSKSKSSATAFPIKSTSAANGKDQLGQFPYIFDGREVQIGQFRYVDFMSFIKAVYEGAISDEDATRSLLYPSKSMISYGCGLQQVTGQHLIFEGRADGREIFVFAVLRDASFESKHPSLVNNYWDMRGVDLKDIMPDMAFAFEGREEFTTKGGFARRVPTFRVVP